MTATSRECSAFWKPGPLLTSVTSPHPIMPQPIVRMESLLFARTRAALPGRLDDLVVRRAGVEMGEELAGLGRDDGNLVILPREGPDRVQGIEPHDRHELHLGPDVPSEEMDAPVPRDAPTVDSGEDLLPEQRLVGVGVPRNGPAMPDSTDHREALHARLAGDGPRRATGSLDASIVRTACARVRAEQARSPRRRRIQSRLARTCVGSIARGP